MCKRPEAGEGLLMWRKAGQEDQLPRAESNWGGGQGPAGPGQVNLLKNEDFIL